MAERSDGQSSSGTTIETSAEDARQSPPWLAEALLFAQRFYDAGLVTGAGEAVRVARGRVGRFEARDFVLVLLVYAVSGEATLRGLYDVFPSCAAALAAVWQRVALPSRSALSRWLAVVPETALDALRTLLFNDLLAHGVPTSHIGGLLDRDGTVQVVFDGDGTVQVARQRRLVAGGDHPPPRRRLAELCAPGYAGRKRSDAVRTRLTLQQAHTREWLGTWGHAGNGDTYGDLARACAAVVAYLRAHGHAPAAGVLRLDGLYGHARTAALLSGAGLGYLMRCADYRLLDDPRVQARLAQAPDTTFVQPDTDTTRSAWDLGVLRWIAGTDATLQADTRFIVTARAARGSAPKVGVRRGDLDYEIFATDRPVSGWAAQDVLSVYFARGGFEQTLAEEDREQDPDRWCSGNPHGQELWQLISQWVWNARLRLGMAAAEPALRRTLWAPALPDVAVPSDGVVEPAVAMPAEVPAPPEAVAPVLHATASLQMPASPSTAMPAPPQTAPSPEDVPAPPGRVAAAFGRGAGKFGGTDFTWQPDGTLRCPAGKTLRRTTRCQEPQQQRWRYEASPEDCAACPLSARCRGPGGRGIRGRCVSVLLHSTASTMSATSNTPAPSSRSGAASAPLSRPSGTSPGPMYWDDLPATTLRRALCRMLRHQHVDFPPPPAPPTSPPPPNIYSRAQRAHRRLSWTERLARNAQPPDSAPYRIRIFGVPQRLSAHLAGLARERVS